MHADRPEIVCALVQRDQDFLMVERKQAEGTLLLTFPSGKIEPGETPESAAARETWEETTVVAHGFRLLAQWQHPNSGKMVAYMLGTYVSGRPTIRREEEEKIANTAFLPAADILERVKSRFHPAVEALLRSA